ncbi:MAG TPA: UDP-N-acetylmuramoyl-L-alanyl-D-glutamate--2,6-diaminopimelate ligase [Propionibacteriaceae bacterium]|nr:UDP-N-acetylmuramoyl-L-alanyl-D-glutamate--2,6-diaminopimelate ligase [Propionibacteriaceae bacterium]
MSAPPAAPARPRHRGGLRLADLFPTVLDHNPPQHDPPDHDPAEHNPEVRGITLDSRRVRPGDLYVALPGRRHHGARFAADAVRAGAVAVLTDAAGAEVAATLPAPVVVVADPRSTMAPVAARIYGNPSKRLTMLGVTGTNGKTTTTYLLDAALRAAGRHVGLVGTIGFLLDGQPIDVARTTVTTPESPDLQALLAMMADGGADSCVMEVSSHAMALGRADAIAFDVTAFTNFGRDHLDFHGSEEAYFAAKSALFTGRYTSHAVVNIDDAHGRLLVQQITAAGEVGCSTLTLAGTSESAQSAADYTAIVLGTDTDGRTHARLDGPQATVSFHLNLPGDFNVRNAATALAMLDVVGVDIAAAAGGLATAQVPGRMQRVSLGPGAPGVFVDFAHTPQAVSAALGAVSGSRCVVVLGCGGDRDPDKRAPIGAAAAQGAAVVVVTDDNPRSEDPASIRAQVLAGASRAVRDLSLDTTVIDGGDRRSAIRTALRLAGPGDVVAVLGKGHESGQEVAGHVHPFDDRVVIAEEWSRAAGHGEDARA